MSKKNYYIYILTNKSNTLYIGITNNLYRRLYEHKNKLVSGFTKKYNINKLIYYEVFDDPESAITREKEIKGWIRKKKIQLIKKVNSNFKELEI
jgi:putative endonuclease